MTGCGGIVSVEVRCEFIFSAAPGEFFHFDEQALIEVVPMNDPLQELREQMVELQTQLAFQEDVLQALDAALASQQQQLDRFALLNARLERQFRELLERLDDQPDDRPPPHY